MKDGMMHKPACAEAKDCPAGPGGMGMMGHQHGGPWMSHMEDLGLTAEQRAAMKQVFERYRTRGSELAQRGSAVRSELMNVSPDDSGYVAATANAAEATAGIAADVVRLMSEMRKEVHAILTEEQRQKLKERAAADRERWQEWRDRHKPTT
jgi:Spy/CpxP family protein refolding chaperone